MLSARTNAPPVSLGMSGKPLDIVGFATRYGLIAIILGTSFFTLLVPVVFMISQPNYEVMAALKIDPVIPSLITKSDDPSIINYFQEYAQTQARCLKEFEILAETLDRLSPVERNALLPKGLPTEKCVDILEAIIRITPVHRTHLIELGVSGSKPEGLAPLLNHLMTVFLEKVRKETEMKDNDRVSYLTEKRRTLSETIAGIEKQLQTLSETIHTASFSEDFNVLQQKAQQLQKLAVQALGERVLAEKEYQQTQSKIDRLKSLSLDPMVDEVVMRDQSLDFTSSWTYQQLQQLRSSIDGITKENPDRIQVEQRMQAMRDYENKLSHEVRDTAGRVLNGKRDYELQKELIERQKKFEATRGIELEVASAFEAAQKQAGLISKGLIEGEALRQQLNHIRDLLFRIDTRIHELMVETKAPLRISIEWPARTPVKPSGSNTKKLLMMCLAASFGSVSAGLLAYDFFDNRIRRPRDIEKAIGHPPTWPISKAPEAVPFDQLLVLAPNSQPAKALRSLVIRLNREREENQSRIFLFTGVDNGTGCSGITLNCARALSEMAPKVLLVTSETTPPVPTLSAELPACADAIAHDPENRLDRLTVWEEHPDPKSRPRLHAFFQRARNDYDVVCIDAGPILTSDLTEFLAVHADVVVLISQGDSTLYRNLRRSTEILVNLEVPAIAPVLNWGGTKKNARIDLILSKMPEFLGAFRLPGKKQPEPENIREDS